MKDQDLLQNVSNWNTSRVFNESRILKWVEIAKINNSELVLGVSCNSYWVRVSEKSVYEFFPGSSYTFLLPLLESSIDDVKKQLSSGLDEKNLPITLLDSFPFKEVVILGVASQSEHWCNLALKWVEEVPFSKELFTVLSDCKSKAPTQQLRHFSKKVLRKIQEQGRQSGFEFWI